MTNPIDFQLLETAKTAAEVVERRGPAFAEPKLDGWRGMAEISGEGRARYVRLWNRGRAEVTAKLPMLCEELALRFPPDTIVDGEFCTADDRFGKVSSVLGAGDELARSRQGAIRFAIFDLLRFDGIDMTGLSYVARRDLLVRAFDAAPVVKNVEDPICRLTTSVPATDEAVASFIDEGFEGAVIKLAEAPYSPGARGRGWFRIKHFYSIDVVAMERHPGEGERGERRKLGAIEYGQLRDGELVSRGRCGGGFTDEQAIDVWDNWPDYQGRVFELIHFGIVDGEGLGAPRHPQFRRWRFDKSPAEVAWHDR